MHYLSGIQQLLILCGVVSFLISLYSCYAGKEKVSVLFLVALALFTGLFMASLDPFLNIWDERFHALVAKNMMNHPFEPTLYDNPVVDMDYNNWDRYHIWLHKQPLFLWQIALSFKLFGVSEFTLRLPNAILFTVLVFSTYRSGKLLVNQKIGYISGLLMIFCYFILNLLAGRQAVDHSDFSFLVYVSLSVWALLEYQYSGKKFWLVLIGIFAGCAMLCKWLVGLLVYFGWFVINLQKKSLLKVISIDMMVAFLITLAIALPWQFYIFKYFPAEAKLTYLYNMRHFYEALDNQTGQFFFHFSNFDLLYGDLSAFLIVPGFACLIKNTGDRKIAYSLLSMVLVVYLFFSVSTTKMPAYTIIVALPVMIAFASLLGLIHNAISECKLPLITKHAIFALIVFSFVFVRFDFQSMKEHHFDWKNEYSYSSMLYYNRQIFKELDLPENTIIFNVRGHHYIESMFYTGLTSYNMIPSEEQYLALKEKNYRMAIFKPVDQELPPWVLNNPSIIVIDKVLRGYSD